MVWPPLKRHLDGDVLVAGQGDVVDEEADHAFAFPLWGSGIGPQGGEVGCECGDAGLVGVVERGGRGGLAFVVLLGCGEGASASFQSASRLAATRRLSGSTAM